MNADSLTAIAVAICGLAVTLAVVLYGINMSVRDICLQLKQLRESLPLASSED